MLEGCAVFFAQVLGWLWIRAVIVYGAIYTVLNALGGGASNIQTKGATMDQQTIITLVVSAIVTLLGFLYRYNKPLDPVKSWLEMGLSIIGAIVIAFVLGKVPGFVNWGDPVAAIQFFLEIAAVVFAFVQLVYSAVKQVFPASALVVRAFSK